MTVTSICVIHVLISKTYFRSCQFPESCHFFFRDDLPQDIKFGVRVHDLDLDWSDDKTRVTSSIIVVASQLVVVFGRLKEVYNCVR